MATFKIFKNNRLVTTIPGVLAPITLAGVVTTIGAGGHLLTVTSTAGIYAGMAIACPSVPVGSFVASVLSTTVLELACSTFNRTTGVWSTSAANAQALTAGTGQTAVAFGYHPYCIVEQSFPLGVWRNEIRNSSMTIPTSTYSNSSSDTGVGVTNTTTSLLSGPAQLQVPALLTNATVALMSGAVNGTTLITPVYEVKDDTCAATPLKRHNGEPHGIRPFVSTGGYVSHVPATPEWFVHYSAV